MKRNRIILAVLLVLTLLSLRGFVTGNIIFTTWDFAFPMSLPQVQSQLERSMSIITAQYSMGYADNQNPISFYFWLYIYPLIFVAAQHTAKILIGISLFLSGLFMYRLLRYLGVGLIIALVFSAYFMFNPFFYSRMIAGHYGVMAGVPFSVLYVHALIEWLSPEKKSRYLFVVICLAFVLSSFHPMMMGVIGVLTTGIIAHAVYNSRERHTVVGKSVLLGLCVILINAHWLVPMGANYFRDKPFFRGDLTVAEETVNRISKVEGSANPIWYPFFFYNRTGLDTEYVYPVHSKKLWFGAQILLAGMAVLGIVRKKKREYTILFTGLFLTGMALTSGMGNPVGTWLYTYILSNLGPVFFEFSNSNRFLLLPIIGGSIFMALGVDGLLRKYQSRATLIAIVAILCVGIRVFSYFDNSLFIKQNDLTTPYSYFTEPFGADEEYILGLFNEKSEYRKALAPPFQISPVGIGQINYGTMSGVSFINDFFNGYASENPFQHFVISAFASPQVPSQRLDLALSLANVSELYFPTYNKYYYFLDFGQYKNASNKETLYESNSSFERTLSMQTVLAPNPLRSKPNVINVYQNPKVQPRIQGISSSYLLGGSYDLLFPVMQDERFSLANSTVMFARLTGKQGLLSSTDVVLPDSNTDELLYVLLDPLDIPQIMLEPRRQIKNYYRGEYVLAAIPGKRKGIVLEDGSYEIQLSQNTEAAVALLHIATTSAVVKINGITVCQGTKECSPYHQLPLGSTSSATLTVHGGRLYLSDLFITGANRLKEKKTELQSYLNGKHIHIVETNTQTVRWATERGGSPILQPVRFTRLTPDTYSANIPAGLSMLYFSQQFDEDWVIEGYPTVMKLPAGADGMLFILNGIVGQITIKHHVQSYVYLGYCITLSTWFIVCCLQLFWTRSRHEKNKETIS